MYRHIFKFDRMLYISLFPTENGVKINELKLLHSYVKCRFLFMSHAYFMSACFAMSLNLLRQ